MPDDDSPDENNWQGEERRGVTRYSVENIRSRLDGIAAAQRDLKRDIERLRGVVSKVSETGTERGFIIRRVEERLGDLYARFLSVEQRYIPKEDHEKSLAPFRKWGSWIAMLIIGGVVTAVMALVLGKGAPH